MEPAATSRRMTSAVQDDDKDSGEANIQLISLRSDIRIFKKRGNGKMLKDDTRSSGEGRDRITVDIADALESAGVSGEDFLKSCDARAQRISYFSYHLSSRIGDLARCASHAANIWSSAR